MISRGGNMPGLNLATHEKATCNCQEKDLLGNEEGWEVFAHNQEGWLQAYLCSSPVTGAKPHCCNYLTIWLQGRREGST